MTTKIDFPAAIAKFDTILARGLCSGVGTADGQMCIEAAITVALGLPFNDEPECVATAVRRYKIALNDKQWSSPAARAAGLRDLGIAQIGSKGIVDDKAFLRRLSEKTIRVLVPTLFRECFPGKPWAIDAANDCEREGTAESARRAKRAAYDAATPTAATDAAATDAYAAAAADKYLLLSASLALEVLRELNSPGCAYV